MKLPLLVPFLALALSSLPASLPAAELPASLNTFLGEKPAKYQSRFSQPAKALRRALQHSAEGKNADAIRELTPLTSGGNAFAEHALYNLGLAQRNAKDFGKSTASLEKLRLEYPSSPYDEAAADLIVENACDRGVREGKKPSAVSHLQRCLERTSWRGWADREAAVTTLYEIYKSRKDPLYGPLVAEIIQAMPAGSALRGRLVKEIPGPKLEEFANVPRYRTRTVTPAGVKPTQPDQELFDEAMQEVLRGKWGNARQLFRKFEEEFPQSEHRDRNQYWLARSEEEVGDEDEAKRRYESIFNENPLTYYGLQCGLRLKKDLSAFLVPPPEGSVEAMRGTPYPRQAMALWRLRALLEEGLVEPARMEARALFNYKPGGSTFGQDNAAGAALTAYLYHAAGYSNASFSHAYAAYSLDPKTLNTFLLDILFPQLFPEAYEKASGASGVNPFLLLSVSKQESAFLPNAVSRANAFGLMQLLLATAREMEPKLKREDLFEPGPNTLAGSRYLAKLLKRFDGNIALALAGYNAGPTRAAQWQKKMMESERMKENFDVDTFIDTIPFTETRRYVGSILRNYAWYKLIAKDGKVTNIQELAFQWQKSKTEAPIVNEAPVVPESPAPAPAPVLEPTAPKPVPPSASPPSPPTSPKPENSSAP
jgi:soluble lytic murein transglycosylase-like protein